MQVVVPRAVQNGAEVRRRGKDGAGVNELAGNAVYWLGETYYVRKDYARAATYFLDGFQKYPQSRKGPDNLLKLGMTLGELNHKAEACQALNQVAKKYPKAPEKVMQRASAEIKRLSC